MYNTTTIQLQPNSTLLVHTYLLSFTLFFIFSLSFLSFASLIKSDKSSIIELCYKKREVCASAQGVKNTREKKLTLLRDSN